MKPARRPSPQTTAVVLAIAEDPERWCHGYDLCRRLGLRAGTVYPILIRVAERGFVETSWGPIVRPGRPPRHLYRLSRAGAEYAATLPRAHHVRSSTWRVAEA